MPPRPPRSGLYEGSVTVSLKRGKSSCDTRQREPDQLGQ